VTDTPTFLTNHLEVLLAVDRDRDVRLRDLAVQVGVTERTAQAIVADLTKAGYLTVSRVGRRNRYEVNAGAPFRDRAQREHTVGRLLDVLAGS
jgi:DNA-binding IclR family transcriptional regulator